MIGKPRPWAELVIQDHSVQWLNMHNCTGVGDENELILLSSTLLLLRYSLNSCCRLSCDEDSLVTVVCCGLGGSAVRSVPRDSPVGRASKTA